MTTEFTGTGDPARSMALLWRTPPTSGRRPGPKPSMDVDRIVSTAVTLADAEGLAGLSMRRVAAELGVAAMTLYGHVPGKGELGDLMLDSVLGELYADGPPAGNWRARLEAVAHANRDLFLRHPWAIRLATGRPPLGPHLMRKYDLELRTVDGLGLDEAQMDLLVTLVNGFVRGTVSGLQDPASAQQVTGIAEDPWWTAMAPHAERFFDAEHFPTAARVGPVAGIDRRAADARERSFEFGLDRLLDGIGVLILNASR
jgi:AcrR family transcriptional regulator